MESEIVVELFVKFWAETSIVSPAIRSRCATDPSFSKEVFRLLSCDSTDDLIEANVRWQVDGVLSRVDRQLDFLREVDKLFGSIHPRTTIPAKSHFGTTKVPRWLNELRIYRIEHGFYAKRDGSFLIPRGPLTIGARSEITGYCDNFSDRFSYLSLVPINVHQEHRTIPVDIQVFGPDVIQGVPPLHKATQRVAFIPVVEQFADLLLVPRQEANNSFVDFQLASHVVPSQRLIGALTAIGLVDVAIAPELVVPESEASNIQNGILKLSDAPRVLVAGSGPTDSKDSGQTWNQSAVFNAFGSLLWHQRKVLPAALHQNRSLELGLPDPGVECQTFEDNAAGSSIVMADIDAFGRCLVLICKDLEAEPMAEELVRHFQPDWVFVPIMDSKVEPGGWVHQKAFELSARSHAKYIVCTSTALPPRPIGAPSCGLAIGPKDHSESGTGRLCAVLRTDPASTPGHAAVDWGVGPEWTTTHLTTK